MSEHTDNAKRIDDGSQSVGRRGLFAWAATLAGAGLAWMSGGGKAEASHGAGTDTAALHVNQTNSGTARTFIVTDMNVNPSFVAYNGTGPFSIGLGDAVQGISRKAGAAGVHGRGSPPAGAVGAGVLGDSGADGTGVVGLCGNSTLVSPPGVGVYGQTHAAGGVGVRGQIPTANLNAGTIAMYGENLSPNAGGAPGNGGFGAYGYSAMGHGLVGATGTAGGGALIGSTNGVPGAYAGIFYGQMVVLGAKNAAVPDPEGGHRLLYCMESPESWFEDFGNATLDGGSARVAIDPAFAGVADVSNYHVYLTPYGKTSGLYVAERTHASFRVETNDGDAADITFSWRLVAKRKDIEGPRLARITLPPEPQRPSAVNTEPATQPTINPAPAGPKRWNAKHTHAKK